MGELIQYTLQGLAAGGFYALAALGLAVIFGVLGVVNFSHGACYMLGAVGTAASRSRALPEDVGYAQRQRIGYELVEALVNDLATGLAANLRETFADILRP